MSAYILTSGCPAQRVKNLGWLLRHWKEVRSFTVYQPDRLKGTMTDCVLQANLGPGRIYTTDFASVDVLWNWLHRPVFFGLTVYWFGVELKLYQCADDRTHATREAIRMAQAYGGPLPMARETV